jgi:transcriptional regulator with GAF, ATPase, and Fis domain
VAINCAGIVGTLAESLLFGHEKGSFTGADDSAIGAFRAAHRGILFLDEVGELPLEIQPKLLRALELREVMPVGSTQSAGRSPPPRATTAVRRPCLASRPRP